MEREGLRRRRETSAQRNARKKSAEHYAAYTHKMCKSKRRLATKRDAITAIQQRRKWSKDLKFTYYHCPICKDYHLTTKKEKEGDGN